MKKISKKIVALATMAAFVLTLVPAAAFAAAVEPDNSYIYLSDETNARVNIGQQVDYTLELKDNANNTADATSDLYIWAEDEDGDIVRSVEFYDSADEQGNVISDDKIKVLDSGYALKPNQSSDAREMAVAFTKAGTYTIHAGYALNNGATITSRSQLADLNTVEGQDTITVRAAAASELASVKVEQDGETAQTVANKGTGTLLPVLPNNTATKSVTLTAQDGNNTPRPIANKELQITTSSKNLVVTADNDDYTTDRRGQLTLTYKAAAAGSYKIYVKNADDNFSATLNVDIDKDSDITDIAATVNNGQTIELSATADLSDAVQLEMKDAQGNTVANNDSRLNSEPIMKDYSGSEEPTDYVEIVSQPEDASLTDADVAVIADTQTGAFTLAFASGVTAADLAEGEYTVQLALLNGDNVQVTFTLAEFGTVQDMIIDMPDEVVMGERAEGSVKYVDENGIEHAVTAADDVTIGYSGLAVNSTGGDATDYAVRAKSDEQYLGATIKVTAVDDYYGFIATKDITVVDGVTEGTLAFDPTTGESDKENVVNVSVVDEDGNTIDVDNASIVAYVAETGDADANVSAEQKQVVNNGVGKLAVYSDVETTADIVVAVKTAAGEIYASTLSYTFGKADVNADKLVAMTIGSTDYIVNNDVVAGDAAPYIDSAWRTMVPVRALAETFGATVNFEDNVVTIVDGDTEIVMTIGETTYTVNGEEQTMDTAPVIGSGDRTYVPVRFVAEALGYTVTPLQDANGLTASVVFQK